MVGYLKFTWESRQRVPKGPAHHNKQKRDAVNEPRSTRR
jgi:hypothetical protein